MAKTNLTAERLRELLHYDPETGLFTRKISTSSKSPVGSIVGCDDGRGYRQARIDHSTYRLHRLAWLYMHGAWPEHDTDHIDGDRSNNKFSNLREATRSENLQNQTKHQNNTSGFIGVSLHKPTHKWRADICIDQRAKFIGLFASPELANEAYKKAKLTLHTFNPIMRHP